MSGTVDDRVDDTVDDADLRATLRRLASGVVVVTANDADGAPTGVTLTSFTSVSLRPPLVSLTLERSSRTWPALVGADWFGVQVMGAHQSDVAHRFAARAGDRFAEPTRWQRGPHEVPFLTGCLSYLLCRPYKTLELGDHHLMVGEVSRVRVGESDGDPLVHVEGELRPVESQPARPEDDLGLTGTQA